jgi:CBS domain containing-hemolysin-like protein
VLTPRVDVEAIDISDSLEEILAQVRSQNHSRLPVYEDSIDNIIGILQIRRFIKAWLREGEALEIRPLLDEPYFIHQSTNIDELLPLMSKARQNMAVVTDNYGGTLGIVTVEDILEELVGEIWDEEDVVVETCVKNPDGSFSFDAEVDIEDAFQFMDYEDPDEFDFEHKLLGEWTYEQFDHLPAPGDGFTYNGLRISVQEMDGHRILKLRIEPLPEGETEEADEK